MISSHLGCSGDTLAQPKVGHDITARYVARVIQQYLTHWSEYLEWRSDIPRPQPEQSGVMSGQTRQRGRIEQRIGPETDTGWAVTTNIHRNDEHPLIVFSNTGDPVGQLATCVASSVRQLGPANA